MRYLILLLLLCSCSSKAYLSSTGYVVGVYQNYVEVKIDCSNVRRPDCYAVLKIDRKELGDVSVLQKLELEKV